MRAIEDLAVHDGRLGGQLQDMRRGEGPDKHFQAAEAAPSAGRIQPQIVAADGSAPTSFVDDAFKYEAWKLIGHIFQAAFDAFGEFQTILRVKPAEFFFVYDLIALGLYPRDACPLPPFNRFLQPLLKFHDSKCESRDVKYKPQNAKKGPHDIF